MKVRAPSRESRYFEVKDLIHGASLHTICEEARCPNIAECWGRGTATFQILGDTELEAAFADVWCTIPKVVFSRTLDSVQGNARLAEASLAEEIAAALDATDKDVAIGGAGLAAAAIELGLVDELRMFRYPVVVGGGTPFLPPVTDDIALDLIETRTFGSLVLYECYRPAREESQ